ncbi:MAG: hypothetical protein WC966_00830 [Bradymonadales bacterium]
MRKIFGLMSVFVFLALSVVACDEGLISGGTELCGGIVCKNDELCKNNICQKKPIMDKCANVQCLSDEICVSGQCQKTQVGELCGGVYCTAQEECVSERCQRRPSGELCGGSYCKETEICFAAVCQARDDTELCAGVKCKDDEFCSENSCKKKESPFNCGDKNCNDNESCIYQQCLVTEDLCGAVICKEDESCLYNECLSNAILCAGRLCTSNELCIDNACVANSSLCGGKVCANTETCINSVCVANSSLCGGKVCSSTETCINSVCIANSTLCGGKVCASTETCVNSVCVANSSLCGGKVCASTETCINSVCVANSSLCGGKVCASTETCVNNVCTPKAHAWAPDCKPVLGRDCVIIPSTSWPYKTSGTTVGGSKKFSVYSNGGANSNAWMVSDPYNSVNTSEAGPEVVYVMRATEAGVIAASITEPSGGDVDVHLLSGLAQNKALARGDKYVLRHVPAGIYYIVVDTYSSDANAGAYHLTVFFIGDSTKCGVVKEDLGRINTPSIIELPQSGKIAKEAHMVSTSENVKPSTSVEYLSTHYNLSAPYYSMSRTAPWCPLEGGTYYGQGSSAKPPIHAEVFYINMYWKPRPANGERWIVFNPLTGKAVVGAAGYETGSGDGTFVGGVSEETHHYLGTAHSSHLMFGRGKHQSTLQNNKTALNKSNPGGYGPIDCFN